jgi:hypothetical protein
VIDADIRDVTPVLIGRGYEIYVSPQGAVKRKVTAVMANITPEAAEPPQRRTILMA